ncbi:hypothetical protein PHMEG_00039824 [Phytophthora megakarya]|uniref:Uncharacterized protein n=1 Tax=Phytophthora megakarya TaxID=4795 RepID=A0A225UEU8_9STRA|nr:hypothetical protein PHMEG_00039824 [Phytophthora megakarya]
MGKVEGEARLRDTKAPWLPPDFTWFIQRAWRKPEVLDRLHLQHRLEVLKNLVVTSTSNSLPSLWTLSYPKKGEPVELRIHSDFSGDCVHEPLEIKVYDNILTRYPKFFQVGITALSIASAAIPIGVVGAAVEKVLAASKSALDEQITVKSILDKANLGPGNEKSSQELASFPTFNEA